MNNQETKNVTLVKYGVLQGSILVPLLFLFLGLPFQFDSDVLNCIMFEDDANLFYSHTNINALCLKLNNKLDKINDWFIVSKPSLSI